MVFSKARLNVLDCIVRAQGTYPRLAWIAFFLISLPVKLATVSFAALPSTLVDLIRIPTEPLWVIGGCAALLATPQRSSGLYNCSIIMTE
jgi:hypothetical protein